jgi:hypothetical protein
MDNIKVASELVRIAKGLVGSANEQDDPMADERLGSLYTKFHTWATKKGTSLPPGAPVVTQIIKGMTNVGRRVKGKGDLRGREAVQAILDAMSGSFTMDAPPIPMLVRKYGMQAIREMFRG